MQIVLGALIGFVTFTIVSMIAYVILQKDVNKYNEGFQDRSDESERKRWELAYNLGIIAGMDQERLRQLDLKVQKTNES